jgi:hypothetical protein
MVKPEALGLVLAFAATSGVAFDYGGANLGDPVTWYYGAPLPGEVLYPALPIGGCAHGDAIESMYYERPFASSRYDDPSTPSPLITIWHPLGGNGTTIWVPKIRWGAWCTHGGDGWVRVNDRAKERDAVVVIAPMFVGIFDVTNVPRDGRYLWAHAAAFRIEIGAKKINGWIGYALVNRGQWKMREALWAGSAVFCPGEQEPIGHTRCFDCSSECCECP